MDDEDLTRRAYAAWFRTGGTDQPSRASSGVEIVAGRAYVRLASGDRILAIYRVENIGRLKRLRRWPKELETW
jgi:hypothetical protein